LPGLVQPVELPSLVKQGCFWGVQVFGLALIDDSAAETDDASARIPNGKHQPVAEAVVEAGRAFAAAGIAFDDHAQLQYLAPILFLRSEAVEEGVPGVGRVPQGEVRAGFRVDSTRAQVFPCAGIVREVLLEKAGDLRHDAMQVGGAGVTRPQGFARHLEARALREVRHGVEELHLLVLHEKADRGAMRAAAEAVVELLVRTDPEGRRLLVVERTAGLELAPRLLQRNPCADDLDDIGTGDDFVDEGLWDAAGHGPPAINRRAWL